MVQTNSTLLASCNQAGTMTPRRSLFSTPDDLPILGRGQSHETVRHKGPTTF
ncbi:unnamed protein product [Linum tenue]|uniref:Uncharacterized protein n=1 Tax=Linum tenue TaxID=586396 RepID=A0AAV0KYR5_9ROSI|nr:unnamed protein product [Linum tenue]